MNAVELFMRAHQLETDPPKTNMESLEVLGALTAMLLRREIERDATKGPDQPLDIKRLRDMAGLLSDLMKMERENDPGAREVHVYFSGETEGAAQ